MDNSRSGTEGDARAKIRDVCNFGEVGLIKVDSNSFYRGGNGDVIFVRLLGHVSVKFPNEVRYNKSCA